MKLEKSAGCWCYGSLDEYTPDEYKVKLVPEKNIVAIKVSGPHGYEGDENGYSYLELEKSEAAKFGADIVAAATGIKE